MDDLDRAQQREEQDRERSLAAARSAPLLPATLNDDHAIRQLLEEHINAALNELCDRLAGLGGVAK